MRKSLVIISMFLIGVMNLFSGQIRDRFYELLDEIDHLSDTQKDSFAGKSIRKLHSETEFPLVDGNRALFVYYGAGSRVALSGDMTGWAKKRALKNVPGTKLFYTEMEFEKDARLDYRIIVDGKWILDPLNGRMVGGSYGENSYFVMPEYLNYMDTRYQVEARGVTEEHGFSDGRKVTVYLPASYQKDTQYKTVYFIDGYHYLKYGNAVALLDYLIDRQILSPVIAVFIDTTDENSDFLLNDTYRKFVTRRLLPWVEQSYSTVSEKKGRYLIANSIGALEGCYIIYKSPELFDGLASQSGALLFTYQKKVKYGQVYIKGRQFLKQMSRMDLPVKLYLVSGVYEDNVLGYYNYLKGNKKFYDEMLDNDTLKGIQLRLYNQGHSWGLWQQTLSDSLLWLLEY